MCCVAQDYIEGQNCHFTYGPASKKGTAKNFCKEFGRLHLAGCLPALQKVTEQRPTRGLLALFEEIRRIPPRDIYSISCGGL